MRALLVANPAATTTSPRARDVITRALGSDLKVDVALTQHRGHACELAAEARRDGVDVVIALGGDGTVNEVVNGLLAAGVPAWDTDPDDYDVPYFAVVPGGSTNVFARAVGLPASAIEATSQLLDAARERRHRRIGLGRADDRYFTFCAGLGLDAEVLAKVEELRAGGRPASASLVIRTALRHFFMSADRRSGPLAYRENHGPAAAGISTLLIANTAPWTYLHSRPINPVPHASFESDLDAVALRSLRTVSTARHVLRMLSAPAAPLTGSSVETLHDVFQLDVVADRPVAFQVDGEALGMRTAMTFSSVRSALRVLV